MKKDLGLSIVVFAGWDDSNSETMKNISESIEQDAYDKGWIVFNSIDLIQSNYISIVFNYVQYASDPHFHFPMAW